MTIHQVENAVKSLQLAVQNDLVLFFAVQFLDGVNEGCLCKSIKVDGCHLPALFCSCVQDLL